MKLLLGREESGLVRPHSISGTAEPETGRDLDEYPYTHGFLFLLLGGSSVYFKAYDTLRKWFFELCIEPDPKCIRPIQQQFFHIDLNRTWPVRRKFERAVRTKQRGIGEAYAESGAKNKELMAEEVKDAESMRTIHQIGGTRWKFSAQPLWTA